MDKIENTTIDSKTNVISGVTNNRRKSGRFGYINRKPGKKTSKKGCEVRTNKNKCKEKPKKTKLEESRRKRETK